MRPSLEELEVAVERLERRLDASLSPASRHLLLAYRKLDARFRADLDDPRDLALSRGAALMLARFLDEGG